MLLEFRPRQYQLIAARSLGYARPVIIVASHTLFVFNTDYGVKTKARFIPDYDATPRRDIYAFLVFAPDVKAETDVRIVVAVTERNVRLDATIGFDKRPEEITIGIRFDICRENQSRCTTIIVIAVVIPITGCQVI